MVMFKAPWVKVSATPLEEKNNLFQATILSMQNEEAILQIKDSSIEFCASIHSKMVGKWDKMCGYTWIQNRLFWQH